MTMPKSLVAAIAMWLLFMPTSQAAADAGAAVGQTIPHDMNLSDQTGTPRTFKTLTGGRGAILLFTRSLDW
jgi:hypothetical protein